MNFLTGLFSFQFSTPAATGFKVKAEDLGGITTSLTDNLAVIAPWGLGILAIFLGIKFIPRLINMWIKG